MGNSTFFIKSINGATYSFINWENMDTNILENGYPYIKVDDHFKRKVKTIDDLGSYFNDCKFFGYFDNYTITKFIHICKNINTRFEDLTPRLYFEEENFDRLHFIEFNLLNRNVLYGYKDFEEGENIDEVIHDPENWKIIKLKNYTFIEESIFDLYSDVHGISYNDIFNDPHKQIDLRKKKTQNVY